MSTYVAWTAVETNGLPDGSDWSKVHPLEVSVLITEMVDGNLVPVQGFLNHLKLDSDTMADLKKSDKNIVARAKASGALVSPNSDTAATIYEMDADFVDALHDLKDSDSHARIIVASANASGFTKPLIDAKFPRASKELAWYCLDTSQISRWAQVANAVEFLDSKPATVSSEVVEALKGYPKATRGKLVKYIQDFRRLSGVFGS